jgi:hypothetical protein
MLPTNVIGIGTDDNIGTAQEFRMCGFPLEGAGAIASGGDIPRQKQIDFWLTFND